MPRCQHTFKALRYIARILKGSHSFRCTYLPLPSHLPIPEGWKAELALGGWLVTYRNICPAPGMNQDTVAHLSTNRARRRLTSYIKANAMPARPPEIMVER